MRRLANGVRVASCWLVVISAVGLWAAGCGDDDDAVIPDGGGADRACVPQTCAELGNDCGDVADGCGGTMSCGVCANGEVCGGGGVANVCGEEEDGVCGDGQCTDLENCTTCAMDCGACPPESDCGNDSCEASEHCGTCAEDCGACTNPPPPLARGPYLQRAAPREITLKWRTEDATGSEVLFGERPDALTRRVSASDETTNHEVRITGLSPDTRYYYAFGAEDAELHGMNAEYFFATFPEPDASEPTRIWIIGDSGEQRDAQQNVYRQYLEHTGERETDLWLMLGDNAYDDGTDDEYQGAVFEAYSDLLRNTVVFPTLGNHDDCLDRTSEANCADLPQSVDAVTPYYEIFTLPENAEGGGLASDTEAYYSFDYGNIHFVCLNSQTHEDSQTMETWLRADLTASTADWIIAFWHHPPYTNGSHNSDREGSLRDMRTNFVPILEEFGVDLVFTGHSHNYERTALLNGYYGDSATFDPSTHAQARLPSGALADGDPDGDGAYIKADARGAVYSVVGSSSKVSGSDFPTDYWTCPNGFMESCSGGPMLPGMVVYLEHLGSVVVDLNDPEGIADVVFLDATDGTISDHYRIAK